MGCWNNSCSLSNLPIFAGEEVYVFFLQEAGTQDKYVGNHCYPSNYYFLLPLHFLAEYNDYGSCENWKGDSVAVLETSVKENLFELEWGENKCHDIPVKTENFDMSALLEADQESRLFVSSRSYDKSRGQEKCRLTHIQIKKSVVEGIIKNFKINSYHAGTIDFEFIKSEFDKLIDKGRKISNKLFIQDSNNYLSRLIYDSSLYYGQSVVKIDELLMKVIDRELDKDFVKEQLCIYALLSKFMNKARKVWIKPSGEGSQDSEVDAQRLLANLTLEAAIKTENHWEDEE